MPCRDYETDSYYTGTSMSGSVKVLKIQADRLARIACTAMKAYEAGTPISELLKDNEVASWWADHKKADEKERLKAEKEKEKKDTASKLKRAVAAKLTDEELAAFGLHKNGNKK
jgi:hypothetical protein